MTQIYLLSVCQHHKCCSQSCRMICTYPPHQPINRITASLTASLSLTIITPVLLSLPCHRVDITVQISQQISQQISVQILSTALPRVPVWMWPAPRQSAHWTAALLTTLRRPPGPGRPPPYSHQAIEYRVVQSSLQSGIKQWTLTWQATLTLVNSQCHYILNIQALFWQSYSSFPFLIPFSFFSFSP